jgi:hypothetical protein
MSTRAQHLDFRSCQSRAPENQLFWKSSGHAYLTNTRTETNGLQHPGRSD